MLRPPPRGFEMLLHDDSPSPARGLFFITRLYVIHLSASEICNGWCRTLSLSAFGSSLPSVCRLLSLSTPSSPFSAPTRLCAVPRGRLLFSSTRVATGPASSLTFSQGSASPTPIPKLESLNLKSRSTSDSGKLLIISLPSHIFCMEHFKHSFNRLSAVVGCHISSSNLPVLVPHLLVCSSQLPSLLFLNSTTWN